MSRTKKHPPAPDRFTKRSRTGAHAKQMKLEKAGFNRLPNFAGWWFYITDDEGYGVTDLQKITEDEYAGDWYGPIVIPNKPEHSDCLPKE